MIIYKRFEVRGMMRYSVGSYKHKTNFGTHTIHHNCKVDIFSCPVITDEFCVDGIDFNSLDEARNYLNGKYKLDRPQTRACAQEARV